MILENYDTIIFNEVADICNKLPVESITIFDTQGDIDMKIRPYDEKATKDLLTAYWYNHIYPQPIEVCRFMVLSNDGCYQITITTRRIERGVKE